MASLVKWSSVPLRTKWFRVRVPLQSFIPNWFVTSKILEKFHDALLANDDMLLFNEDCSKVTFFADEMGISLVDVDKMNLGDNNNIDKDDLEAVIHVKILAWHNKFEKR